ncbi:MAG: hypothetical protein MUC36_02100 [Planctomycetes bacterium]|nr:hypothetical protein [Planctomycetota bacterium]
MLRCAVPLLFLPTLLCAQQQPDPFRYVPDNTLAVLRMQGGKAMHRSFEATSIGKVFAEPAVRAAFQELWRALPDELDLDAADLQRAEPLLQAIGDFEGELVAAVALRPRLEEPDSELPFDVTVSLQLLGSEEQRAALDRALAALMDGGGTELRIDGEPIRVHGSGRAKFSEPLQRDGATVLFFCTDPESGIASCLAPRTAAFVPAPALTGAAFGMQIEAGSGIDLVLAAAAVIGEGPAQELETMLRLGGLPSMHQATYTLRPEGKWIAQDVELSFRDGNRGVLGAFLPSRVGPSRLLALLPADAKTWNTWRFDAEQLHRCYVDAMAQYADQLPMSREELEAEFTKATKLRLHEDLLALLGDEWLRIDDLRAAMDIDAPEVDERLEKVDERLGNSVFAIGLRDGATLAKNVEKMLRARGLHAARKSEEYGDTKVYRLTLLGSFPLEYAFAGDLLVIGLGHGEGTRTNLRRVLDAQARQAKEPRPAELPAAFAARMEGWPGDAHAFDATSMLEALDGLNELRTNLTDMLAGEGLDPEDMGIMFHVLQLSEAIRPAIARHGGDVGVTAWWFHQDRLVTRSRW